MATAADIKTRANMQKLKLEAAVEEMKNKVAAADRRSKLQQRVIDLEAKFAGDRANALEQAEKRAKMKLETPPTSYDLTNVISGSGNGVPQQQAQMDTEMGTPSEGGGQLGQVIREAMGGGSVPESLTQRQTTTEWGPHPFGSGYIGMPTRRTTTTEIPTGMTQYQRAMLAQRQMEVQEENRRLQARNLVLNQQTKNEMAALKRQELAAWTARLGSVDDALAFMTQDPSKMSPELRAKVGKAIEAETGMKVAQQEFDNTIEYLKAVTALAKVGMPSIKRRKDAGLLTHISQLGLDELVAPGIAPPSTPTEWASARGSFQSGAESIGKMDWNKVTPGLLWASVGMPASHFHKMVIHSPAKVSKGWLTFNTTSFDFEDDWKVFYTLDAATQREDSQERRDAQDQLEEWKITGSDWDETEYGPMPNPVPADDKFAQTSKEYIRAWLFRKQVLAKYPDLAPEGPSAGIIQRREDQAQAMAESRMGMEGVFPNINRQAVDDLTEVFNQTVGRMGRGPE